MKAVLAFHDKQVLADGTVVEMKIWDVPRPVAGSKQFKYSLFYGRKDERLVGYDNERGKGDHRHIGNKTEEYVFSTVENLIDDFLKEVRNLRGKR